MHIFVKIIAVIVLVISLFGLWNNLPNRDLTAIFDEDAVQQAMTNNQINLLLLTLCAFGIGASSNYLMTSIGITRGYGDAPGRIVFAIGLILVLGGLVIGVVSNLLKGVMVPLVMNPGTGLIVGSLIGLVVAKKLHHVSDK
ncbi:MAG: hypothetical protein R3E39_02410 [Anaerolineae bacterium]